MNITNAILEGTKVWWNEKECGILIKIFERCFGWYGLIQQDNDFREINLNKLRRKP